MGSFKVTILLLWVLFTSCSQKLEFKVEAKTLSLPSEREIEAKLKILNKPALKTIKVFNFTPPFYICYLSDFAFLALCNVVKAILSFF